MRNGCKKLWKQKGFRWYLYGETKGPAMNLKFFGGDQREFINPELLVFRRMGILMWLTLLY